MSFDTENRRIADIFQRNARYSVPRYQRAYVWEKVNWAEFLRDIRFTVEVEEGRHWTHFLGTIVLGCLPEGAGDGPGVDRYEIIDGQQRLMTVYAAIAAAHKRFLVLDTEKSRARAKYLESTFLTSLDADGKRRPMIANEDFDRDIAAMLQAAKDKGSLPAKNAYAKVFAYFDSSFEEYDTDGMDAFFNGMLQANVVEIVSGEDEEIYNIFEVLNARGQHLKQIELLKNHVLKYLQPRDGDHLDKAKAQWGEMLEAIEGVDGDDFVSHFAKAYIPKSARSSKEVYRLFKDEVDVGGLGSLLTDIVEFSKSYAAVVGSGDPVLEYFDLKNNRQVRPLLASIALLRDKGVIGGEEAARALRNLRNCFFHYNVGRNTSNKIDKAISEASYAVYHCRRSPEFVMAMTALFREVGAHLSRDQFDAGLLSNPSLAFSNKPQGARSRRLVKYALVQYCNYYQGDVLVKPDEVTVEHLRGDDGSFERSLLGNLTLTSSEINAEELRDKPVEEKVSILAARSNIAVNRSLGEFVHGGSFDFAARQKAIADDLYERVFPFQVEYSSVDLEDLDAFLADKELLKDDPELLDLLLETGSRFRVRLDNDPNLASEKERYMALRGQAGDFVAKHSRDAGCAEVGQGSNDGR